MIMSASYGPDTMLKGSIYFIFFKPLISKAGPYYCAHFIDSENLRKTKLSKITCE